MNNPKPSSEEIARRKVAKACRLLGEACGLTGKKDIAVRVDHIDQGQTVVNVILEPSHKPTRHRETPLPIPKPGQRADSGFLHDSVSLELERRIAAAKRWSAKVDHGSELHRADYFGTEWGLRHHSACTYEVSRNLHPCDCQPLFLARLAGQIFAVNVDGQLERFTPPTPRPADFRNDMKEFYGKQALGVGDIGTWLKPLLYDDFTFATAGHGENEHFIELPEAIDP